MLKKILISLIIILSFMMGRAFADKVKDKVLIVYDVRHKFGYDNDEVLTFKLALGHFDLDVYEVSERDYSLGLVNRFDYVFVMGLDDEKVSERLKEDLIRYKGIVTFIGSGFEDVLSLDEFGNFKFLGKNFNAVEVIYKNSMLPFSRSKYGIGDRNSVDFYDVRNGQVIAYFNDGKREIPYIFNYNNIWVVTRYDSEGPVFYILCDVLHEILKIPHREEKKVFVRIEDVHARVDIKRLRRIGDYLKSEGIPYMIALIPAYKENGRIYKMSDNREFVETIRYLQSNGASIVLHGYTHQIRDERTGEGYEFWDIKNNRPPSDDMEKYMQDRIYSAVLECVKNGIYPLAFEAPHYAINKEGYDFLKKHFSTYVGHIQTSNYSFCTTAYPFKIQNIEFINRLIPENLGYVYSDNINDIFKNLDRASIVRDYYGGFYFHTFMDINYLKKIVKKIEDKGFEFYDLKMEDNYVNIKDITIQSKGGNVECNYRKINSFYFSFNHIQKAVSIIFLSLSLGMVVILIHSITIRRENV
ncbi:polysaccharide deacetylase family protein [Thermobrachium celere]|uniref:Conserved protein n=1 Tax=Thermobrachium celere DSM 8682 TaxID=941824 RepID=R7RUK2_9CLOT|nr:polysaccharide deacetylase family protein [Thermobrachium celere]CDF59206.1 Conserved protein [Thermobrachium celere DSM 8682]